MGTISRFSLNVNFQYRDAMRANLYRLNFVLRRMGLRPTPPGASRVKDMVKSIAVLPAVWAKKHFEGQEALGVMPAQDCTAAIYFF